MDYLINEKNIKSLKRAYKKAVKEGKTMFEFERHRFVTDYAKYLIQYYGSNKRIYNKIC